MTKDIPHILVFSWISICYLVIQNKNQSYIQKQKDWIFTIFSEHLNSKIHMTSYVSLEIFKAMNHC